MTIIACFQLALWSENFSAEIIFRSSLEYVQIAPCGCLVDMVLLVCWDPGAKPSPTIFASELISIRMEQRILLRVPHLLA